MQQEHEADQGNDDAFLEQRALQRRDGAVDEFGPVINRYDVCALGQRRLDLFEALLDVVDDGQSVGAGTLQGDAACDLSFAVEFGDAAPLIAYEFDTSYILEQHGCSAVRFDDDALEVGDSR